MRWTSARDSGDEIQRSFNGGPRAPARVRQYELAIERQRGFQRHQRAPGDDPSRERFGKPARFRFAQPNGDFDSRRAQLLETAPRHSGIWVRHGRHDARDARGNQLLCVHGPVRPVWQQGSRLM